MEENLTRWHFSHPYTLFSNVADGSLELKEEGGSWWPVNDWYVLDPQTLLVGTEFVVYASEYRVVDQPTNLRFQRRRALELESGFVV